jgi:enoyl-CoA hydratase/carnithine racemase
MSAANPVTLPLANYQAKHVRFEIVGKVATLTLDRPDKKNPLTFDSYAEVVNIFRAAARDKDLKVIVVAGAGGNFSSGGDVFEIIGPLIEMDTVSLLDFTRMTGEVVKAMRACPQPIIAAIDGVCAGAGAAVAMACDIRIGTPEAKIAFLFKRAAIWALARCCRASSAKAAPPNCSIPAARSAGRKPNAGASSIAWRRQRRWLPTRRHLPRNSRPGRRSAMP